MNNFYKVHDHPHLLKDMNSKAVLNTNHAALLEYKKKQQMADEIQDLKNDISDIKEMLKIISMMMNK